MGSTSLHPALPRRAAPRLHAAVQPGRICTMAWASASSTG